MAEDRIPDLILDVLMSDGGWLTTEGVQLLLPGKNPASVRRALERMSARGLLERRTRQLSGERATKSKWKDTAGIYLTGRDEWRVP